MDVCDRARPPPDRPTGHSIRDQPRRRVERGQRGGAGSAGGDRILTPAAQFRCGLRPGTDQLHVREALKALAYCLNVPRTVFEQWTLPWVVSPMVTSLFEQNWLEVGWPRVVEPD